MAWRGERARLMAFHVPGRHRLTGVGGIRNKGASENGCSPDGTMPRRAGHSTGARDGRPRKANGSGGRLGASRATRTTQPQELGRAGIPSPERVERGAPASGGALQDRHGLIEGSGLGRSLDRRRLASVDDLPGAIRAGAAATGHAYCLADRFQVSTTQFNASPDFGLGHRITDADDHEPPVSCTIRRLSSVDPPVGRSSRHDFSPDGRPAQHPVSPCWYLTKR